MKKELETIACELAMVFIARRIGYIDEARYAVSLAWDTCNDFQLTRDRIKAKYQYNADDFVKYRERLLELPEIEREIVTRRLRGETYDVISDAMCLSQATITHYSGKARAILSGKLDEWRAETTKKNHSHYVKQRLRKVREKMQ